jgi:hypothetical protein
MPLSGMMKAEPLGDVEPFDDAGNLHEIHRVGARLGFQPGSSVRTFPPSGCLSDTRH